ncbi:Restriction endonuclease [Nostocoides australiense Ben110]|uniref:Restriction endonuclease n=1 Tax=Nostocoides australiense Ben110 TaxID=1193182 RepID=W6JYF4_9MICO|nr:restriction endonuclease [Tetrasphaera australiensis]CCH74167.1 Restriction endonuclease [Tetrasphaera australiensis Ben110]
MKTMWGIHNDALGAELVDEGFISVGWEAMPDLRTIGDDMTRMKEAVQAKYPSAKPGAVPVWAGVLRRFAFDMAQGDLVVAPYRPDGTLNFGVISGPYEYVSGVPRHPHRRRVTWTRTGVARSLFPQAALYEIGSAVTLFQVRKHDQVFRDYLASADDESFESTVDKESSVSTDSKHEQAAADEPNADRIDQHTRDFIARVLLTDLSDREFEEFTADLLRAMGYQARVTPYSQDGGIDVIAHTDALGIEPPIIKVQCKHTAGTRGRPDVQQLIGTLSHNEAGLFVTLGSFSADAVALERERQNLRLFSGADVTNLTLAHYDDLPARWRTRMPLRRVLVVDRDPEDG